MVDGATKSWQSALQNLLNKSIIVIVLRRRGHYMNEEFICLIVILSVFDCPSVCLSPGLSVYLLDDLFQLVAICLCDDIVFGVCLFVC